MELAAFIRALWQRRLIVTIGAVAAIGLGFFVGSTKSSSSAVAWTRVVLDTPSSQVIEAAPAGADSLPWRASLLTHLIAGKATKQRLAGELGIEPGQVAVVDPSLSVPEVPASLPSAAAEAAAPTEAPFVVTAYLSDPLLPIISIEAQAPDTEQASRLAAAAASSLKAQAPRRVELAKLSPTAAHSDPATTVPRGLQGFIVEDVAPVRVEEISSQSPVKAVTVSIAAFGLWCACVALGPLVARLVRERGRVQPA